MAASRYRKPWSLTSEAIPSNMAPVAAETMPERPSAKAMMVAMENEAYSATLGSTHVIMEKAIASGTRAIATMRPASRSLLTLDSQSWHRVNWA